ncbi:hypothetical protein TCSYLVIO_005253 [Trypanosoma cruzi]|nr:hypothetical protein TCSYLVIO_005253 [Trypanosoma cruzi]
MYADELTLVASGAGIHACAAAMQPSLSLTTTWAPEHSLKTNVDKSEAALFYFSSHTRSDEEMVDLHPGNGNLRIQSCPVRLLGTTIYRLPNFGTHASTTTKRIKLSGYQLRLVAQTGASHHTMQSFSIVYVHSVSLYSGETIPPCLAPTYLRNMEVLYRDSFKTSPGLSAPTEDTYAYLEANLLPLQKILWLRALTQYERYIRLHDYEDLRSLTHSEPMPPFMHGKAAASIPLPRNAVINELQRVRNITGIPRNHLRAPPLTQHRIIPWDTVSCKKVRFYQPPLAQGVSDDVKRTAFGSIYSSLGNYDFKLWADGSSSLAALASAHAALFYDTTKTNDLRVEVHRAAAGRLIESRVPCH